MIRRALALALVATLVAPIVPAGSRIAFAQPAEPDEKVRAEARDRFERGKRFFNEGNNDGALAEFKRAYELIANPVVLYNIGLVYALMGRPVEAADALDKVLASPGTLSADRVANAKKVRDEQALRIGEISVDVSVEGASIEVDTVEVGKSPLKGPLRVASGTRVVGVVAPGYAPQRKELTIAGGDKQTMKFDLVAMQGKLAHVVVKTHLPGAEVFVDDQRVGTTPLAASVTLAPGAHKVELRRAGYTSAAAPITLGDGATGEVVLEPTVDATGLGTGGLLALDVTEPRSNVTIDGQPRGVYEAAIRLPRGPHHLIVDHGDFEPVERDVDIESGRTTTVRVLLEPTPAFRARFTAQARTQRTWGWIAVGSGAVVTAGAIGLLAYDATQRSSGNDTFNTLSSQNVDHSGQPCDIGQEKSVFESRCIVPKAVALAKVSDANQRDIFGYVGLGIGVAVLGLGVAVLATSNDPSRFDRKPEGDAAKRVQFAPTFWTARGGGGVGVVGAF